MSLPEGMAWCSNERFGEVAEGERKMKGLMAIKSYQAIPSGNDLT